MKKMTIWALSFFLLGLGGDEVKSSFQEENEFTPLLRQSTAATRKQVAQYYMVLGLPQEGKVYLYGLRGLRIITASNFPSSPHTKGSGAQVNQRWYNFFTRLKNAASEEEKIGVLNKVFQFHSESINDIDPLFLKTMKEMGCKSPLEKKLVK